jgi:hypothetical protein
MARKQYETEADRKKERVIASIMEKYWKCEAFKMPYFYKIDFCFMRDKKIVAIAELKNVSKTSTKYKTYMISVNKMMEGKHLAEFMGVPFFLIVSWLDGIGYVDVSKIVGEWFEKGGRADRVDDEDLEPVMLFPIKQNFTMLGQK